jgi:Uma2 family endonuclease
MLPKTALVKSNISQSAFCPDILVLDPTHLSLEKDWQQYSTLAIPQSIPLVIEVVSTHWRDDYYLKFSEYEALQIPEYWIVDYGALGARKFIGNPKQPTLSVCQLMEGEYQMNQFQVRDSVVSATFPQLNLTAQQIMGE